MKRGGAEMSEGGGVFAGLPTSLFIDF